MEPESVFTIYEQNSTSELKLYVNGSLLTTYNYAGGEITLSARVGTDVIQRDHIVSLVGAVRSWYRIVRNSMNGYAQNSFNFREDWKRTGATLTLLQKIRGQDTLDLSYVNQQATFQPRAQVVLKTREFEYFLRALERLIFETS